MSEPAPVLRLVGCQECERLRRQLDALSTDFENAQTEMRSLRRKLTAAKKDEAQRLRSHTNYKVARDLLNYWRDQCGHPNAQEDDKRIAALLARLENHTPREVAEAIKGAAVAAYVDPSGRRHDKVSLICRDEEHFDDFRDRYLRWKQAQQPKGTG